MAAINLKTLSIESARNSLDRGEFTVVDLVKAHLDEIKKLMKMFTPILKYLMMLLSKQRQLIKKSNQVKSYHF